MQLQTEPERGRSQPCPHLDSDFRRRTCESGSAMPGHPICGRLSWRPQEPHTEPVAGCHHSPDSSPGAAIMGSSQPSGSWFVNNEGPHRLCRARGRCGRNPAWAPKAVRSKCGCCHSAHAQYMCPLRFPRWVWTRNTHCASWSASLADGPEPAFSEGGCSDSVRDKVEREGVHKETLCSPR